MDNRHTPALGYAERIAESFMVRAYRSIDAALWSGVYEIGYNHDVCILPGKSIFEMPGRSQSGR